jgi:D-glycero-D-manno-heptose 1,7-bisphosphate phosphatase
MNNPKIKNQKQIVRIARKLKKEGKKIVTYSGSFDVLHIGHIKAIKEAKKQGDILIILLNSDKSVKSYKGPTRPIILEDHRAEMLAAIQYVDYIYIFDEINVLPILEKIKPNIHANAENWGKNCIERSLVESNGGRIHILKTIPGHSTTSLIKKIMETESAPKVKAVFLDRDKTINYDPGYIHKIEDFRFIPGAINALKRLSDSEYLVIIVTGQSGIGRGFFTLEDFHNLNNWMLEQLVKKGITIDRVYLCPHHPDEACECRKPNIGMLLQAVDDFGISLNDSWMIGDKEEDVIFGRRANVRTIKIGSKMNQEIKLEPHYYARDLQEAVGIILKS